MGLKKLIAGFGLIAFSFGCYSVKPNSFIKPEREVVTTVEHYVQHKTDLKCKDVAKVTHKGFDIYACESDLNQKLIQNFEFVADVKDFGNKKIKLVKSKNYQVYKNRKSEKPKTLYWLYVTKKFYVPEKRDNWIVITEEGRHNDKVKKFALFTSRVDNLKDEKEYFEKIGYDVYWRKITNFADNCDLEPDFFKRSKIRQADTILHEELHMTVDEKDWDLNLEESIACLIGEVGAMEYFKYKFGESSIDYQLAKSELDVKISSSEFLIDINNQLKRLYASDLSTKEKLKKKKEIFKNFPYMIKNNANLWDSIPYDLNFPLVYKVYQKNPNFKDLVNVLNNMPKTEKKGIEYLKEIISEDTL